MNLRLLALFTLLCFASCTRILERLGSIATLEVSPSTVFLHDRGDTALVQVSSDVAWTVTLDDQAATYFSVEPKQGTGNGVFIITALKANGDAQLKQGVISIGATDLPSVEKKTVLVTQQSNSTLARNAFGGAGNDEFVRALPLANGDFIVAARSGSSDMAFNDTTYGYASGSPPWILRLTREGTIAWKKQILREYHTEWLIDMVPTADGQFLIAGNDGFLTKFDASGNITWDKFIGPSTIEDIVNAPDGGYILAVTDASLQQDGWQLPFDDIEPRYYANSWIMQLDAEANIIWKTPVAGSGKDRSFSVSTVPGGGYVLCGYSESTDHSFADRPADKPVWVARFDPSGQQTSMQFFSSNLEVMSPKITGTSDGGYLIANSIHPTSQWHVRLSKINANGNTDWEKTIEGMTSDYCYDVIEDSQGYLRVLIAGNNLDGIPRDNDKDGWILTLNAAGSLLDLKRFGGFHRDIFNSITETSPGSFVMAGSTDSDDGDVIGYLFKVPPTRDRDGWIMLY